MRVRPMTQTTNNENDHGYAWARRPGTSSDYTAPAPADDTTELVSSADAPRPGQPAADTGEISAAAAGPDQSAPPSAPPGWPQAYQVPQGHQVPQGYQAPQPYQGSQSYQGPQSYAGPQSYQAPQSYQGQQTYQGPQISEAPRDQESQPVPSYAGSYSGAAAGSTTSWPAG